MTADEEGLRVVIAVTETSSVTKLWRTALETLGGAPAEVLAVFVHDERWQRAASLPFTREVSRAGGVADFTTQRANQVFAETVSALQKRVKQLAAEANLNIEFRVLPESDDTLVRAIFGRGKNVLIAPSFLADRPIYAELTQLDLHIQLVDADDSDANSSDAA